ncbi:MAG: hypothetical protein AAB648_00165, partial [Patescibacteria group bacterium]
GKRIYIGKAGSLKKRIASYFRASDPRIKIMVSEADTVSFKKTNSILEAVILEANAIKKYLPKYNIKEKDNRSFVYLIVSKGDFPKIFIARGREVEKYASRAYIFGPYQSYRILKTALNLARKIFPFGICLPAQAGKSNQGKPGSETLANVLSDKTLTLKAAKVLLPGKPCFDYQIGLCPGICIGVISNKDYQKNIKNLILFFKGEHKRLFKKLKKPARHKLRSQALAGGENPEKIFALKHVQDVALINNSKIENLKFKIENSAQRIEGYDISHFGGKDPVGAMVVFSNGVADNSQYRLFKIRQTENRFDDLAMLREVLERRLNHKEWRAPDIILIDGGKNQVRMAKKVLEKRNIFIPIVGIAKILGHSGSAAVGDKFFLENTKPRTKKLLLNSKMLFQQVRNEAHRFAISFQRKRRKI